MERLNFCISVNYAENFLIIPFVQLHYVILNWI